MTSQPPLVSIGLPVYNGSDYLRQALESLVAQTYVNFEIVVSDNGSTDDTSNICSEYSEKYQQVKYHRYESNRGIAWNRNNSFHLSAGELFMWFSHDDVLHPDYVKRCVSELLQREATAIVYSKIRVIDADGQPVAFDEDLADLNTPDTAHRFRICLSPLPYNQSAIYGVMKKSTMGLTPLHGDYLAADRCLMAQLSLVGRIHQIPEYLFFRRKHAANIGAAIEDIDTYRPGADVSLVFPEWNVLKEHIRTVNSHDCSAALKTRLYAEVARWVFCRSRIFLNEILVNLKKSIRYLLDRYSRNSV